MKEMTFILVIIGIFFAELNLNLFSEFGFLIYAILVGVILILMENEVVMTKYEKIFLFLMIIPICRLAEFFVNFGFFWKTFIFYLMIIFLVIFYAIKLNIKTKPFIGNPIYFMYVVLGAGLLSLIAKYIFNLNFSGIIFLIPIIAYAEEILFRGGIQNLTEECFGNLSILSTSLLYAIFSMSLGFEFALIAFGASIILSTCYYFTKNLYLSFALNITFHGLVFALYPMII